MTISHYLTTSPQLGEKNYVHPSAQVIGDVRLGDDVSIWCNAVLRGDVNHIVVGRGTNIQDLTMCHVSHKTAAKPEGSPLVIGDFVTIGHSVILHGCQIGNECLIGMGSTVMDDVVIENQVMVGAGSLVPPGKHLESGHLYIGRPVKKIRALDEAELAFLRYSAEHYVRVKNNYMEEQPAQSVQAEKIGQTGQVQTLSPRGLFTPIGPYSHVAKAGVQVAFSGTPGVDSVTGDMAGPDAYTQTRQIIKNFKTMLAAVGCSVADVLQVHVYLKHVEDFAEMNRAYAEEFGAHQPARTVIAVADLPKKGALLTMDLSAVAAG
jgi:reactive intermediate/imine deaminase